MTRFALVFLFCAAPLLCQSNRGELRLRVTDPDGLGLKTVVQISSAGKSVSQYSSHHRSGQSRCAALAVRNLSARN